MLVNLDHLPQASGVKVCENHIQRKQPTRDVAGFFTEPSNGAYYFSATNPMDQRRPRCSSFSQDQQQSHGKFPQTMEKSSWDSGCNLQKLNVGGVYIYIYRKLEKPSGSKKCFWHIFFREVSAFSSLVRDSGYRSRYIEMRIVWCSISPCRFSSWWLNQPIWKIWSSKWDSSRK